MHTKPSHGNAAEELEALIKAEENKELECREYLDSARELLVRHTVISYEYVDTELRTGLGDSDYVISGRVVNAAGVEYVAAYVWELKAPQSYLFQDETRNRLIPTPELFKAENQLFNYYHKLANDPDFRLEFGVMHPDHVRFGGIIIGSRRSLVRGRYSEDRKKRLYARALMIRSKYIYDPLNIKIMTWDHILDYFKGTLAREAPYREIEEPIDAKTPEASTIRIESS